MPACQRPLTRHEQRHNIQLPLHQRSRSPATMTSDHGGGSITSVLQETRMFPPPVDFASKAHVGSMAEYDLLWNRAKDDPEGFWGEQARLLTWDKTWDKVLDWQPPFAKWFVGGQ